MKLAPMVRERIERLADYVDQNGVGVLQGTDLNPITQSQAETYVRFYEGYKREVQVLAIESGQQEPDDPLYGWGWIAQHDPKVRLVGATRQQEVTVLGEEHREQTLKQKRAQQAELYVVKQPHVVATLPMYVVRATVRPTIVPDTSLSTIQARISRLQRQIKEPGTVERLGMIRTRYHQDGIELFIGDPQGYKIGPPTS